MDQCLDGARSVELLISGNRSVIGGVHVGRAGEAIESVFETARSDLKAA